MRARDLKTMAKRQPVQHRFQSFRTIPRPSMLTLWALKRSLTTRLLDSPLTIFAPPVRSLSDLPVLAAGFGSVYAEARENHLSLKLARDREGKVSYSVLYDL